MPPTMIGELAALGASFACSIGVTCATRASSRIGILAMNHVRMVFGILILITARLVFFGSVFPASLDQHGLFFLAISGVTGFFLCDVCLFKSCVAVGARIGLLLISLSPIFSTAIGWIFLDERLSLIACGGIALTLAGVVFVVLEKHSDETLSKKHLWTGIGLGILAAILQAISAATAKPVMIGASAIDPLTTTLVRALFAAPIFFLIGGVQGRTISIFKKIRSDPRAVGLIAITATVGMSLGVWLYMVGVQRAPIAIATTLTSTMPITVLPVAYLINHEHISKRAIIGAVITCVGFGVLILARLAFQKMLGAKGNVRFVAADLDLVAVFDDATVHQPRIHGGFSSAPANGFQFFDGIRPGQKPLASFKKIAPEISAQSITNNRHIELMHHISELRNLRFGEELGFIEEHTTDADIAVKIVGAEMFQKICFRVK